MSSSDDGHNYNTAATDVAVALVVVPNPATDNTETPASVAPDVARPPSNTATDNTETPANVAPDEARPPSDISELNHVPNANTLRTLQPSFR